MKRNALISMLATFALSVLAVVFFKNVSNLVEFMMHQGVILGLEIVIISSLVCIPLYKYFKKREKGNYFLIYITGTTILGTLCSFFLFFVFTYVFSILLNGESANLVEFSREVIPQFLNSGSIIVALQWLIFGIIFYKLVEFTSKNRSSRGEVTPKKWTPL